MFDTKWTPERDAVLRHARGLGWSFAQICDEINRRCNANYSRSAVIVRAKKLGMPQTRQEIAMGRAAAAVRREECKRLQLKDSRFMQRQRISNRGRAGQNVGHQMV